MTKAVDNFLTTTEDDIQDTENMNKNKNSREIEKNYFIKGAGKLKNWSPRSSASIHNEIQVIDMFCGCGGMSLGFESLGRAMGAYQLVGGIDINQQSLDTYAKAFGVPAVNLDVRELAGKRNLNKFFSGLFPDLNRDKPLVLIGCAPCQGFTAHRKYNWDEPDERNNLIKAFADVAVKIKPDCVVMENVPELLSERYWPHFEYFKKKMVKAGYFVKQTIHTSASFGVPQERFRAIVIAMKHDFNLPLEHLQRGSFKTVRDAIGSLPKVKAGEPCKSDAMHKSASHKPSTIEIIKKVPLNGGSRPRNTELEQLKSFRGFADVYGRLSWDKPAITITHYARNPASGRFTHPEQHRGLTMREAARIQSFPDGYPFLGGFDEVFRQIGEAVPPLLGLAVAASVLVNLRGECLEINNENVIQSPVNNSFAGVIAGIKNNKK